MHKNPINEKPVIDEAPRRKTGRRKRRKTACADLRRGYFNCGICGSADHVYEVLTTCEVCSAEVFTIETRDGWWPPKGERPCGCQYLKKGVFVCTTRSRISRKVCAVCGSMEGPTCPSCKKGRCGSCWTSPYGEKRCSCGFRHPGFRRE